MLKDLLEILDMLLESIAPKSKKSAIVGMIIIAILIILMCLIFVISY